MRSSLRTATTNLPTMKSIAIVQKKKRRTRPLVRTASGEELRFRAWKLLQKAESRYQHISPAYANSTVPPVVWITCRGMTMLPTVYRGWRPFVYRKVLEMPTFGRATAACSAVEPAAVMSCEVTQISACGQPPVEPACIGPTSSHSCVTSVKLIIGWFCDHTSKARCIDALTELQSMNETVVNLRHEAATRVSCFARRQTAKAKRLLLGAAEVCETREKYTWQHRASTFRGRWASTCRIVRGPTPT